MSTAGARRQLRTGTILVHGTQERHPYGATLPPVVESTAFAHESAECMEAVFAHEQEGHAYSRLSNPTVAVLEARITAICGARGTVAVASGMSAVALALLAILRSGDHLVASKHIFGGTFTLLETTFRGLGIATSWVDGRDADAVARSVTPQTRAIFVEAIANPAMIVPDFMGLKRTCKDAGIPLIVDATLVTPLHLDTEATGADIAIYSGSKFLAGAATTIGGLIVDTGQYPWGVVGTRVHLGEFQRKGPDAFLSRVQYELMVGIGPCLSPHAAFLQLVGLETLGLRLARQTASTLIIAKWLRQQPGVRSVLYPGLSDHPDHQRCMQSFKGSCGSVLSFLLDGAESCYKFLNALELISLASNLGDTRTLALHPASTIYHSFWPGQREDLGVADGLIRLSVGIEDVEDLQRDLASALNAQS